MNFSISGFFITAPVLVFIGLWMHILSIILYTLDEITKKTESSRPESFNKLIASDLVML